MRLFLSELFDFFKHKSIYRALFLTLVLFYAVFFIYTRFIHPTPVGPQGEETVSELKLSKEALEAHLTSGQGGKFLAFQAITLLFGGLFFTGIGLNYLAIRRWQKGGSIIEKTEVQLKTAWGISEILKVSILFFTFGIFLHLIVNFTLNLFGVKANESLIIFHAVIIDLLAIFFMVRTVLGKGSGIRDFFGFDLSQIPWREWKIGLYSYVMILPTFLALVMILITASTLLKYDPPPHPLVHIFLQEENPSWFILILSVSLACFIGPVVEEVFFRAFLYPALKKYFGMIGSMTVTSALFAGVHENIFSFIPIFFLGVVLCYIYEKRKNILPSIVLHIAHNSLFLGYFLIVKDALLGH